MGANVSNEDFLRLLKLLGREVEIGIPLDEFNRYREEHQVGWYSAQHQIETIRIKDALFKWEIEQSNRRAEAEERNDLVGPEAQE